MYYFLVLGTMKYNWASNLSKIQVWFLHIFETLLNRSRQVVNFFLILKKIKFEKTSKLNYDNEIHVDWCIWYLTWDFD
jgi:hypothetical protein